MLRIFFHPPWLPWQLAGWFSVGTCSAVKLASDAWAGGKRETVKYFINPYFIDDHRITHTWLAGPESKKQSSCEARMEKVVASILAMFSVCKLLIVVLMSS